MLSEFLYFRYIVPRIFEVCSGQVSEEVKVKDNRTAIRKMRAAKKKKRVEMSQGDEARRQASGDKAMVKCL